MNFDCNWTIFALDAEVEAFGTSRIASAHNKLRAEVARRGIEGPFRLLVAACNRLQAEAEEYQFDDGMGRGAHLDYWHEFDQALERATEALKDE
jgi:hypothetical protein